MSNRQGDGASETIVYGVSHVDLPTRDLARALKIYRDVLGFGVKAEGEGFVDLDGGGTVALRLVESARPEGRGALRVHAGTVEATMAALVRAGCVRLYEPLRTPTQELVGALRDPDGHALYVWRPLTEDEYDVVPEIPKEMTWEAEADELLKSLLKKVPALFRVLARRRVARVAEELAGKRNLVTREEVIRGFILASPRVTRGRNRQPLLDHGVDVERYREDWEAD